MMKRELVIFIVVFGVISSSSPEDLTGKIIKRKIQDEKTPFDDQYEIVYPKRLGRHFGRRDTTENDEKQASFQLNAFGKRYILDVKQKSDLTSPKLTLRTFQHDGTPVSRKVYAPNCHYHGKVRDKKGSSVILSTCRGLRGLVETKEKSFYIEPLNDLETGAHKIHSTEDYDKRNVDAHTGKCGVTGEEITARDFVDRIKITDSLSIRDKRDVANVDEFYRKFFTTDEVRYNEVVAVVDHKMYLGYQNDTDKIMERVVTLFNAVDSIYVRINIRVVLIGVEIWSNGDRTVRESKGGPDLSNFAKYDQKYLKPVFHNDNAQLLSAHGWTDCAGMGFVTAMCGSVSSAVNHWSFSSIIGPYVVLAHEMGHNFGMNHDTGSCQCLTPRGCIMGGHKTRIPGFSNCSMIGLQRINDRCLYNPPDPQEMINSECGDGIKQGNEECDCGTPEMCAQMDPCCEPFSCKLRESTQCSDLHHSCCQKCLFKRQGSLCRASKNVCDVPEVCTGDSGDCPADLSIQDGFPCNRTRQLFIGNVNYYGVVHVKLSPKIEARYIRIHPQYYHGHMSMRTEVYGCSANEVLPTDPTPIQGHSEYCLRPETVECSVQNNTKIIFTRDETCFESYMEFSLDAQGILRHHCSGMKICPQDGKTSNGVSIVINDLCSDDDATFTRTSGGSLKHVSSGKCIHPNGGHPGDGRNLVLWSGCDQYRLQLDFMRQDCIFPLGMEDGRIADHQITASSSASSSNRAFYGRLNNNTYWRPEKNSRDEWLKIDLSETRKISSVGIQGQGSYYHWVSAFYLDYSYNDRHWIEMSESGSPSSNSNCYQGKCSETRDTQCRELWGPDTKDGAQSCYDKLNIEATGYGTCELGRNTSCAAEDVLCGQIQCKSSYGTPTLVKYGWTYASIDANGEQCSAAVLKNDDSLGQGIVRDGTKCGDGKMCKNLKCKTFEELSLTPCPYVNGVECNGKGVCNSIGECHCEIGYDPATHCEVDLIPVNGGWSTWSNWTACDAGCGGGNKYRHRFCNNPTALHGGNDCSGNNTQQEECNTLQCPVIHSCLALKRLGEEEGIVYPDGVYTINPDGKGTIKTYCDMTRDGGGWTLLVTSHTNSWTTDNVRLRNIENPRLDRDYSILARANDIKNSLNVEGYYFEYRLEAQEFGRWGGVFRVPRSYTFTATDNKQQSVELIKRFDNWEYSNGGIERRMPWISGAKLTTSGSSTSSWWGTITADDVSYHPAPWMSGFLQERQPAYIWYWMREADFKYPSSCMDIQLRSLYTGHSLDETTDYLIRPDGEKFTRTFCDFTREGGGWTLVLNRVSNTGWDIKNIGERNEESPSFAQDFSILKYADQAVNSDRSKVDFQYKLETDEERWGGIWAALGSYSLLSTKTFLTKVQLIKQFDNWDFSNENLVSRIPYIDDSSSRLLTTATIDNTNGGTIVTTGDDAYLTNKPYPSSVRYWARQGVFRSCNEIKLHGERKGNQYSDGYYMIKVSPTQYIPVYCDMSSDPGAYTLLVTSAHNNWTFEETKFRNVEHPSLNSDYSILGYGDIIKSLCNNGTFKYKLDAMTQRHWGGIWKAPKEYSLQSTRNDLSDVTLLEQFDSWKYDTWWCCPGKRLPYLAPNGKGILTTSSNPNWYWWGTIISGNTEYDPAPWIHGLKNVGSIWYWLNEDDCDADREPVHGNWADWSEWSSCDQLCTNGKAWRRRECSNPKPRCGGNPCCADEETLQSKDCYYCPKSPIKSYGDYCIQPVTGNCNPPENTYLKFHAGPADCSEPQMYFTLDTQGVLKHFCSGKYVCSDNNANIGYGTKLALRDDCSSDHFTYSRTSSSSLKNVQKTFCVHPNGGWPGEGVNPVFWATCGGDRLRLDFIDLGGPESPVQQDVKNCMKTVEGDGLGSYCFFPFVYKGKTYRQCTKQDHTKAWCSTTEMFDEDHRWGECSEVTDICVSTFGGNGEGGLCVFPFKYNNKMYDSCTSVDADGDYTWCATTKELSGKQGRWGVCPEENSSVKQAVDDDGVWVY